MNAYLSFLVYLLAILGFVAVTLWLNKVVGPKPVPTALKLEPFECGATPVEQVNVKAVPVKYYAIAILFILFAWVLGKFAWGPLLKIVDEREKGIRDSVETAEKAAAEAKDLLAQHQEMLCGAGREREEILAPLGSAG